LIKKEIPDAQFLCSQAITIDESYLENNNDIKILKNKNYHIMKVSDIIIVKSGTATLEACFFDVPMIIVYKTDLLNWYIGKRIIKIPWIGLPNIIANKPIVPELLQTLANPYEVAETIIKLWRDKAKLQKMKEEIKQIKYLLGSKGVITKIASLILSSI
jgi:lipid-A-disaccharide synthase